MSELKRTFMMCEPTNYGIWPADPEKGFANKFQAEGYELFKKDPAGFVNEALDEWHQVKETIEQSSNVVLVPSMENTDQTQYYDQVFTADASLSIHKNGDHTTFLSRFTNTERNPEIELHKDFILKLDGINNIQNRIIKECPYNIEGTGDNFYDSYRDVFWSGFTQNTSRNFASEGRSNIMAHQFLKAATNTNVNSLQTAQGFFHIDTALSPLPRGHIVFYPGGVDKDYVQKFKTAAFDNYGLDEKTHLIQVNEADANNYACNLLYIGDNKVLVTKASSQEFQEKLKRAEYDVIPMSVKMFRYSGGAFHCITNPVYEQKIEGGYHKLRLEAGL